MTRLFVWATIAITSLISLISSFISDGIFASSLTYQALLAIVFLISTIITAISIKPARRESRVRKEGFVSYAIVTDIRTNGISAKGVPSLIADLAVILKGGVVKHFDLPLTLFKRNYAKGQWLIVSVLDEDVSVFHKEPTEDVPKVLIKKMEKLQDENSRQN